MSDSFRVLLVTPSYPPPPGGIQSLTRNLERGLRVHGADVEVLVGDLSFSDIEVSDVLPAVRWRHSVNSLLTGEVLALNAIHRRTEALIETHEPDLVHAIHIAGWPALVTASEYDVPSIVSTHALELERASLARNAVDEATIVHSVSEYTRDLTREVTDGPIRSRVIPPSIAVEEYTTQLPTTEENGPKTVVTVARLVERKNITTLIDAVEMLNRRLEEDVELRIIGEGPRKDTLVQQATESNVVFEGWVSEEEKRRLLADADVFALVPRGIGFDVEGFGIVYIEAQAAGTPVVGSRNGGVPEAVGDGGLIVDDEMDSVEVAETLQVLLADDRTRARCLRAATRRIDQFDISAVAARHLQMYESAHSSR